ncbi:MAG TPA: Uma2 family endonuclease [Steroidobacteraceae bacterium]|nr:Uma2 family endonuclease [Steroidobacteraceae bacterium]
MASLPHKHLITVDDYYRMAEVGLLAPDARVELIEGEIIDMAPIGIDHGRAVDILNRLFVRAVGDQAIVRVQGAVRLNLRSEPQPDLALLAPSADDYGSRQPAPADVLLLIEVSDSTLRYDMDVKLPLYARHGIPETWIVDLRGGELKRYRVPRDGRYLELDTSSKPGIARVAALPEIGIDLTRLFPSS